MPAVPSTLRLLVLALQRRSAAVLLVLLLHGGLLFMLMQSRPERLVANNKAQPPMAVRYIEAAANAQAALRQPDEPTERAERKLRPARSISRAITSGPTDATPQLALPNAAITLPSERTNTAPDAPAQAGPAFAPLNLTLPSSAGARTSAPSPASLATQDIRANTERVNFGEKLAQDLGSDNRRTEENLGDGRVRIRSGTDCVIAVESRAGQLDPMAQTSRPSPRGVKPCK